MRGCALRLGGITPLSTVDYPGQLACVLFCQGCPWRCGYCHNAHLIPVNAVDTIDWQTAEAFVQSRVGLLDAVVFSGGEPCAQPAVVAAAACVRGMGFNVGLHTSGAYPERLSLLLHYCDWVALDVKTSADAYPQLTGSPASAKQVWQSLDVIARSGVPFEVRTTIDWTLMSRDQLLDIAHRLSARGVSHYALQNCRSPTGSNNRVADADLGFIKEQIAPLFPVFEWRDGAGSFGVSKTEVMS